MKNIIIAGIITLTVLASCRKDEIPTHEEIIYQMLQDTLRLFPNNQPEGIRYYNPDGRVSARYEHQPAEWYPDDDPSFWTEFDLEVTKDSMINNYRVIIGGDDIRHYRVAVPLEVVDSICFHWWCYNVGKVVPEGTVSMRWYHEQWVAFPTVPTLSVYLNASYSMKTVVYIEYRQGSKSATLGQSDAPGSLIRVQGEVWTEQD